MNSIEYVPAGSVYELTSVDIARHPLLFPHRNILATSSPYFRAMFCSDLREAHDFRVSFNEITPDTMNRILEYVYLGNTVLL